MALEGQGEGMEEVGALLAQGVEARADDAEGLSARKASKAAGDLLLDLRHAHGLLGEVVGERNPMVGHEAQHIEGSGAQPVEQIDGLALPRAAALARRRRAWIGGFAFGDDLPVEGSEVGDAILGQRAAYPFHLLAGGKEHVDQALGPSLSHFLEEVGQFPQVMGVAQGMLAKEIAIGLPAVMNERAHERRQKAEGFEGFLAPIRVDTEKARPAVASTCSQWSLPSTRRPVSSAWAMGAALMA